jgi:hypothetical protein
MNFQGKAYILCIIAIIILATACRKDDIKSENTISDDVPGLSTFTFLAKNNTGLFQDITFTKQPDNSYAANIVYEVDLSKIIPTFDYIGKVEINGDVILSGTTSLNFPDEVVIKFDNKPLIFKVHRYYAIPVLYINTVNSVGVTSKTDYVYCSVKIDGKNMYKDFNSEFSDSAKIRGRGNSTWEFYPKKPYRIKLGLKNELLGMGADKDWVLLANYRDPTNFMNAVVFDMARYMGLPYTNTNRFVDVYLNKEYVGMYQLTEQIEQGETRIAVNKSKGVLLNLDLDDGPEYAPNAGDNFYSSVYGIPICVKYPENQTPTQLNVIKANFAEMEQYIKNCDYASLSKRLDISSLIDFLIIQEITRNVELVSPRSMYMYKDADNIYHFGPVWDFDGGYAFDWASMTTGHGYFRSQSWLMGSSNPAKHPMDAYNYISGFFVNMFGNALFTEAYKKRWTQLKSGILDYSYQHLNNYINHCDSAMASNAKRWPIGKDYNSEIEKMKTWLTTRVTNYSDIVTNY